MVITLVVFYKSNKQKGHEKNLERRAMDVLDLHDGIKGSRLVGTCVRDMDAKLRLKTCWSPTREVHRIIFPKVYLDD